MNYRGKWWAWKDGIDDEALATTKIAQQGIVLAEKRVYVASHGALCLGLEKHVGVAGIQAFNGSAFVTGNEG
jgi:hypothetical protein